MTTPSDSRRQEKRRHPGIGPGDPRLTNADDLYQLVGWLAQSLASNPCFATLPISLDRRQGRWWRRPPISCDHAKMGAPRGVLCHWCNAFGALGGGMVGAYGLYLGSFPVFLLGSLLTGVYMSAHGFYRFAATDTRL